MLRILFYLSLAIFLATFSTAYSVPSSYGPYEGIVKRVVDGDTIKVDAFVAPGMIATFSVRVRGIDAPEVSRACEAERELGKQARDFVRNLYKPGDIVKLDDVGSDKYAGRVVANIYRKIPSGEFVKLSTELLIAGLAVSYDGKSSHTKIWCPEN